MDKKFNVGDRVAKTYGEKLRYDEYGDNKPNYGTVTDVLSDGRLMVKWDDGFLNSGTYTCSWQEPQDTDDLEPHSTVEAQWKTLEEAFQAVNVQIKLKLGEAAKLIEAANEIAEKAGLELMDMQEATSLLENAMGRNGWNTSSWHC